MTGTETNTPGAGGETPRRAPRWMKVLLGVSLGLNLLVAAAAAGVAIRHGPPSDGASFRDIRSFARFVPEERRESAREMLESHRDESRAAYDRLHEARRKAGEIFKAEPYDPVALEAALAEMRAASADARAVSHRAMVAIGATLTPEERAEMVDRFRERRARWRSRWEDGHHGRDGDRGGDRDGDRDGGGRPNPTATDSE